MKDKVGLKIEIQYYSLVIKPRLLTSRFQLTRLPGGALISLNRFR